MNRITSKFIELKDKKAFITFLEAGHPDLDITEKLILEKEKAGADIIEIGIPFSDPLADGPIIQNAAKIALSNNVTVEKIFKMVKDIRKKTDIPLVFLVYYNIVFNYGNKEFIDKCIEIGIDGLIIPDLPYEEEGELTQFINEQIFLIPLVSPVSEKRIEKIIKDKKGFVYCVSSLGTTGQNNGFHKKTVKLIRKIKKYTDIPVAIGFGIKNKEDIEIFKESADGIIIGSRIVEEIDKTNGDLHKIHSLVNSFNKYLKK